LRPQADTTGAWNGKANTPALGKRINLYQPL